MHFSFGDEGTGNRTHLGYAINLAHLHLGGSHLFLHLLQHTLHSGVDIVDGIIDDRVGIDFHALALCQSLGICRRAHLESHNHTVGGSRGEHNVVLRNLSHSLHDDVHLHLLG